MDEQDIIQLYTSMNKTVGHISWKKVSLHVFAWLTAFYMVNSDLTDLEWGPFVHSEGTLLIPSFYGMLINVILFYLNAYRLIPVYLKKKETIRFWTNSTLWIIGLSVVEMGFDFIYLSQADVLSESEIKLSFAEIILEVVAYFLFTVIINVFFWGVAFLYRLPSDWIQDERIKSQLIQDKLSAELEFLRAQINPHFLFNGINSIYHLIGYDDDSAKDVLLRFSGLLRYQLYECNEEYISLSKELEYINNYIKLEEIRKGEDACFNIDLPQNEMAASGSLKIAPLIFTPFLENAFKYLSLYSEKEKNKIKISMSIANGALDFKVDNTINLELVKKQAQNDGGIGLENVKRRLNLLYPNKHKLSMTNDHEVFSVQLKLHLI